MVDNWGGTAIPWPCLRYQAGLTLGRQSSECALRVSILAFQGTPTAFDTGGGCRFQSAPDVRSATQNVQSGTMQQWCCVSTCLCAASPPHTRSSGSGRGSKPVETTCSGLSCSYAVNERRNDATLIHTPNSTWTVHLLVTR